MTREGPVRAGVQAGIALLIVLVILLVVAASSASFLWFMNQQQGRAGTRLRSAAALMVAEAGIHRALSFLETKIPGDGLPGRSWRPAGYSEALRVGAFEGRFTVSLADDADGAIQALSVGEVGGVTRRLRARIYLASPALLTALYGAGVVRLVNPPAAAVILPYGAGIGDRPWVHIASGQGVWFATTDVSINHPLESFEMEPGPADTPGATRSEVMPSRPGPVRIVLGRGAELTLGPGRHRVDIQQLRVMGVYVEGVVRRTETLSPLPEVDRAYYQRLAATNAANVSLNQAAGRYLGDSELARKRDSLYRAAEFEQVSTYLRASGQLVRFRGVIYVRSEVSLLEGQKMQIADGALVTEGPVHIINGASLEITHSAATRTLPGLIVLENGAVVITGKARLRVHGLVYASRAFDVSDGARVDVVGAVLDNDPVLGFRNFASTVVIRYDPAVMGTPGLRSPRDAPVVAWVAAWEELP